MSPREETMTGIVIDTLGGLCPVQAEGTIDGEPFYFRARGDSWSIEIGPGNTALVACTCTAAETARVEALPVWEYEEPYGTWPAAGYMEHAKALGFIAQGARRWRDATRPVATEGRADA